MAKNVVEIGPEESPLFVFEETDNSLRSMSFVSNVDISGTNLAIDTMTPNVHYPYGPDSAEIIAGKDFDGIVSSDGYIFATNTVFYDIIKDIPYGTPIRYKRKGKLHSKMYKKSIEQVGPGLFKINAVSAIGILEDQKHLGGFYRNAKFSDVVAEIIGGAVPYTIADELKNLLVIGYLPYASKRQNLHWLTYCLGVMVGRNENFDMHFRFISNTEAIPIEGVKFYAGGSIDYSTNASAVEVTEHSFFALPADETVTIYDNTDGSETANNTFIAFQDAPIHDLQTTGSLTIVDSGANWATISGTGKLTGKKYTHSTRVLKKYAENANHQSEKIASVSDNTLINPANSENVAARMLSYYAYKNEVKVSFVNQGERCGDLITGVDPYGNDISGFLVAINGTVSGIIKASAKIITNYVPTAQGNNYTKYIILTGSGNWKIPAEVFQKDKPIIEATLISGGHGGSKGQDGTEGTNGNHWSGEYGVPGVGGKGGIPGVGGKVFSIKIDCTGKTQFSFSCGAGGQSDQEGGDTTFDGYSSSNGDIPPYGVSNIFTGEVYAKSGDAYGISGGDGSGNEGEGPAVTFGGQSWGPGAKGKDFSGSGCYANGGWGGGAAVGSNGKDGEDGDLDYPYGYGGKGGDGAPGRQGQPATQYGSGGGGGHGGGGGGLGGAGRDRSNVGGAFSFGANGKGGVGGPGGVGGDGCIIIYI